MIAKCENCEYEMEDGEVSQYLFVDDGRYYEFHESRSFRDVEYDAERHDTFICENCMIEEGNSIDIPEGIEDPKEWLINEIKNY
jgi:hypothetical protein